MSLPCLALNKRRPIFSPVLSSETTESQWFREPRKEKGEKITAKEEEGINVNPSFKLPQTCSSRLIHQVNLLRRRGCMVSPVANSMEPIQM